MGFVAWAQEVAIRAKTFFYIQNASRMQPKYHVTKMYRLRLVSCLLLKRKLFGKVVCINRSLEIVPLV